jgi:hypothetical protein
MVGPEIRVNTVSPGLLQTVSCFIFAQQVIADILLGMGREIHCRAKRDGETKGKTQEICRTRGEPLPFAAMFCTIATNNSILSGRRFASIDSCHV